MSTRPDEELKNFGVTKEELYSDISTAYLRDIENITDPVAKEQIRAKVIWALTESGLDPAHLDAPKQAPASLQTPATEPVIAAQEVSATEPPPLKKSFKSAALALCKHIALRLAPCIGIKNGMEEVRRGGDQSQKTRKNTPNP